METGAAIDPFSTAAPTTGLAWPMHITPTPLWTVDLLHTWHASPRFLLHEKRA
jgi:hypothetical protein